MPYAFNPHTYAYEYYPAGGKPSFDTSGDEYIPGYSDSYSSAFPDSPYGRISQTTGSVGGSVPGAVTTTWGAEDSYGNALSPYDPRTDRPSTGGTGSAGGAGNPTSNDQRNAYEYLRRTFDGWGLGSLAPKILEFIQQGYDADTIMLMLQDTSEYKTRFAGNERRKAAGLPVLSPAEYLATERQYRQVMQAAGLPGGFYDSYDDFTGWISGDVSPAEIQERVSIASSALYNSDSHYLQTLKSYGLGDGDLVAYMLDTKKALPLLQKQVRAAQVGAEASRNSLGITQSRAEYFADMGVTGDQARQAYQSIGENVETAGKLGAMYGESFGQSDLEDELLGGSGLASAKRKRLSMKEASRFSGKSGVGDKALSGRSRGEY